MQLILTSLNAGPVQKIMDKRLPANFVRSCAGMSVLCKQAGK